MSDPTVVRPLESEASAPAIEEQVLVQFPEIDIPPADSALIDSPSLMDQLIRNQESTLRFLSEEIAPVDVEQVSVDNRGRVVISNQRFREVLLVKLSTPAPESNNGLCGNVKCLTDTMETIEQ
ncbi:hypothetical protein [Acrocarpospora sp. B8E8]|uniref:hypothetical protein n=1 Tax=Acrocarpospora sp. B8E8 TaxID=3153572 RepID=UPI00325F531C